MPGGPGRRSLAMLPRNAAQAVGQRTRRAGYGTVRICTWLGERISAVIADPITRGLSLLSSRAPDWWRDTLSRVIAAVGRTPGWARSAALYLSAVVMIAAWAMLQQVNQALEQMHLVGERGGGALNFPLILDGDQATAAIAERRSTWASFQEQVSVTRTLRPPDELVGTLAVIDEVFIGGYAIFLGLLLIRVSRTVSGTRFAARDRRSGGVPYSRELDRMLRGAGTLLVLLVIVDIAEGDLLVRAYGEGKVDTVLGLAVGPLFTGAKYLLGVLVVLPLAIAMGAVAAAGAHWRRALLSTRAPLLLVAVLTVLLGTGIGAAQVDDVVRAWTPISASAAVLAAGLAALVATGVTRALSSWAMELPGPDSGQDPQPLLLGSGLLLTLVGAGLWLAGAGWGLLVPAGLLLALWALGLPFAGRGPDRVPTGRERMIGLAMVAAGPVLGTVIARSLGQSWVPAALLGAVAAFWAAGWWLGRRAAIGPELSPDGATATLDGAAAGPDGATATVDGAPARSGEARAAGKARAAGDPPVGAVSADRMARPLDPEVIAGDLLARAVGGWVAGLAVLVVARAIAFDVFVRAETGLGDRLSQANAGLAAAAIGLSLVLFRPAWLRDGQAKGRHPLTGLWFLGTVAAGGVAAAMAPAATRLRLPESIGSVAVVFTGMALLIGLAGVIVIQIRSGRLPGFRLAPALRVVGLRRFPAVAFLVAWVLLVSAINPGGYHDIRRSTGPGQPPATVAAAWQQWLGAQQRRPKEPDQAIPLVLVAAQGGGIRAATWTGLVMECLFGPGPVKVAADCAVPRGSQDAAERANTTDLPVFMASGASGGSVGLAAWAARRTDLAAGIGFGATPKQVEDALDRDFLAPNLARMLVSDLIASLLAHRGADRAAVLESAWEQPWRSGSGLARGLRTTWRLANGSTRWRIPLLAFNGISVEDGCRFLASPVDFSAPGRAMTATGVPVESLDGSTDQPSDAACRGPRPYRFSSPVNDVLPATSELVDYLCPDQDVPLATAAHLSARFPYVSPTGRVTRQNCGDTAANGLVEPGAVSFIADGGIFDNSAASTLIDTWRWLAPLAAAQEAAGRCIVPIFVQIDNSPGPGTTSTVPDRRPMEALAPVGAVLGEAASREQYARAQAASSFGQPISPGGQPVRSLDGAPPRGLWFRVVLYGQPGPEPPLGWTLSESTIGDMRAQLDAAPNQAAFAELRRLLDSRLACGEEVPSEPALGDPEDPAAAPAEDGG